MADEKKYGGLIVAMNEAGEETAWMRPDLFTIDELIEELKDWRDTNPGRCVRIRPSKSK